MILDKYKLDGRIALVTGASAGLGAAIAVALAEAGATVVAHGNSREPDKTCELIKETGHRSLALGRSRCKQYHNNSSLNTR